MHNMKHFESNMQVSEDMHFIYGHFCTMTDTWEGKNMLPTAASILKMEAAGSSKTQVLTYQSKQNHISEDYNCNVHHCDNIISHSVQNFDNGTCHYI